MEEHLREKKKEAPWKLKVRPLHLSEEYSCFPSFIFLNEPKR